MTTATAHSPCPRAWTGGFLGSGRSRRTGRRFGRAALAVLTLGLVTAPPAAALWWRRKAGQSAHRMQESAVWWSLVQRSGEDRIIVVDAQGTLTRVGSAAASLLRTPPEELTGQDLQSLVPPEERDQVRTLLRQSVEGRCGWDSITLGLLRGDRTTIAVNTSAIVQLDRAGGVAGLAAILCAVDDQQAARTSRQLIRERIESVLADRSLTIVVQPIFSLETGRVVGVEALSRFPPQPAQGPDRWFADAHEVGLGVALEVLAVQKALDQAVTLASDCYVSVNVSPATLASPALHDAVTGGPVPPDRIVLELTEHVSVEDYDALTSTLAELRDQGLRLAIDDAGAGFASFRHILRLRPDLIKIDQAITRAIDTEPAHRALAAALVMFVLEVGSTTIIAEGVETAEELRTVTALGIDAAQGYLLGRPTAAGTPWNPIDV